ncbi:MAG: 4-alpha-glucanotransferase [Verrucomicrobia bacterium]|nr:4-alpha-glucanotransferase [Verrucomicrobiota bacterium]
MNPTPFQSRAAGVLLHPTSLPGPHGIGDLGPSSRAWVDALAQAKQQWWQMLPLSPTGFADSPYQCLSTFAGNPNLISPDDLVKDGLLRRRDVAGQAFDTRRVDFGAVLPFKAKLLARAWENFKRGAARRLKRDFEKFCVEEKSWLKDFALFMALKDARGGAIWFEWEPELIERRPAALARAGESLRDSVRQHEFRQFLFFRQWRALKDYANARGVKLIGDIPIFVSGDSADVWSRPGEFLLDERRRPKVVAGVPPDYFSKTGQLWGNPHYDWKAMKQTGYRWWIARVRATLRMVDVVRVDHFRGFEAAWQVPGGDATAQRGRWVKGPGADLFAKLRAALGPLPIIAEDLGLITPAVDALRARFNFPGMRILQFAFGGAVENRFLPHHYERNTIVYTGTHDNDTTRGWFATASRKERRLLRRYLGHPCDDRRVSWELMRLAWSSVADLAIAPLQDVLNLGTEARMNFPGQSSGWWRWRFTSSQLTGAALDRLGEMTEVYSRAPKPAGKT